MRPHSLDNQIDGTLEHNDLVPALLGLSRLLDDLCLRMEGRTLREDAVPPPEQRTAMLAVLGAFSLRRTLQIWLAHCTSSARPSETAPTSTMERLLR